MPKHFSHSETQPIGLLGCGLVGASLAKRMVAAGWSVWAYDPAAGARERIEATGAGWLHSEAEVAARCGCLLFSLPGSAEVAVVVQRILPVLPPGSVIVDTTTGDPEAVEATSRDVAAVGVAYLDATLGGSSRQIAAGEGILLCGGPPEVFASLEPLLASLAATVFHTGETGSGTSMKLVFNLVLGLQRAILAEGLEFARRCGIDPQLALAVLKAGPAHARVMDSKGQKMLGEDFSPEARLAQHWKDVGLIQKQGRANGASLPFTDVHETLLRTAAEAGWGAFDNSAIIKVFQRPFIHTDSNPRTSIE
jgi:3-hydroxyisobutyrate dehydrogenase-like beta-hydroxyacid dehydrogenase